MSRSPPDYQKRSARGLRSRRRACALAFAFAPGPLELTWDAPPDCPDGAAVVEGVRRYVLTEDEAALRAQGRIEGDAEGGYRLMLVVEGAGGSQRIELQDPRCDALGEAASLVLAVAMDPVAVADAVRPEPVLVPAPPLDEPPRPEPVMDPIEDERAPTIPSRPPTDRARPPRTRRVGLAIRPEAAVGTGVLPGVAGFGFGGALVVGRARRGEPIPWRAELAGTYWLPRRAELEGTDAGGVVWLATGTGRGCWVPSRGRVELPLCAGLGVGALGGRGFGGPGLPVSEATDLWVGVPVSGAVTWAPIPALALLARVEAVVSLRRPGFHLEGLGLVHRAGAVGAIGAVGMEVRLF